MKINWFFVYRKKRKVLRGIILFGPIAVAFLYLWPFQSTSLLTLPISKVTNQADKQCYVQNDSEEKTIKIKAKYKIPIITRIVGDQGLAKHRLCLKDVSTVNGKTETGITILELSGAIIDVSGCTSYDPEKGRSILLSIEKPCPLIMTFGSINSSSYFTNAKKVEGGFIKFELKVIPVYEATLPLIVAFLLSSAWWGYLLLWDKVKARNK